MKNFLISQGWNLVLATTAILLGWYFSYDTGKVYEYFFGISGGWVNVTPLAGLISTTPFFIILLLSSVGSRRWYWWIVIFYLPFAWINISAGNFNETWWFNFLVALIPLGIGFVIRTFTKKYIPGLK